MRALLLGFWKDVCTSIGVLEICVHCYWGFGKMCAQLLGFWKDVCTAFGVLERCVHFCVRICYRDMCALRSVITSYLTENTVSVLYKDQSFKTTWRRSEGKSTFCFLKNYTQTVNKICGQNLALFIL